MEKDAINFIQSNSSDGGFLQSDEWRNFQEAVGRRTFCIANDKDVKLQGSHIPSFHASIIEHNLPIVGKYFYIPRWPSARILNFKFQILNEISNPNDQINKNISDLIELAKKNNIGWIRIDPASEEALEVISKAELFQNQSSALKIKKAPHDMQPRELFIIDITKSEEDLLAEMKAKTRYNIKLSQKRGVFVKVISNLQFPISNKISNSNDQNSKFYIDKFIELVKITAKRDGITPHPESYYRKMFEAIPGEMLKLYVAEYQNQVIAANIIIHYDNTATYLHGASENDFRNVMAPYLLQWQAIKDAKGAGMTEYDFGGISTNYESSTNKWAGITKFKTGFSPSTSPVVFPGSYDIVINKKNYFVYRLIQKIKAII